MLERLRRTKGAPRTNRGVPDSAEPEGTIGPPGGSSGTALSDEARSMVEAFVHLPDAIVLVDGTGTIVWGNRSAERIFERSLGDWQGHSGLDLVHPDDQELVLRSLSSIQDKEFGSPIEIRVQAARGWRLVEIVGTTVQWFGESVVLLCLRDLTERRRFEVASGRETRFRSLVHNAGSIIMQVSPIGTVESISGAITRLLGHDPELLEQRPLLDIVAPADRARLATALPRRLLRGVGGPSGDRPGAPAPSRRDDGGALRADHRRPARRSDGRGVRRVGPRRDGTGVRGA